MSKRLLLAVAAALTFLPTSAFAQVTSGSTDVVTDDPERAAPEPRTGEVEDATEFALQAGALVTGGNSRTTAMTGGLRFLLRRGKSELTDAAVFNYARSANPETRVMEPTVDNYQNRLRYDYFLTERLSAFLAWQLRRDRFQALDLRMGIDPGFAYYMIRQAQTRVWGEAGYDFQYEIRTNEKIESAFAEDGTVIEKTEVDHNLRAFLGYDQRLDERLSLVAGVEFYQSVINKKAWRMSWEAQLKLGLIENFALAIGTLTTFDNDPLPDVRKLDVVSSLSFVYTFL